MPYVFVEELTDGQEEADVVSREDYDIALNRIADIKTKHNELHKKYADLLLDPKDDDPKPITKGVKQSGKKDGERLTLNDVFGR